MKLLFDENISWRIKKILLKHFPDCKHVSDIENELRTDNQIWEYAKKQDFIIVTFDEDFTDIQMIYEFPPKIIWLRCGNKNTVYIAEKLIRLKTEIINFYNDNEQGIFEIY